LKEFGKMKKIIISIIRKFGFDIVKYGDSAKSRRTKKLSFYETKTGNYYLPTDAVNDEIAATIKKDLVYDKEVVDIAAKFIRSGTTVLDLGCNFGQMSILFSNLVSHDGKVHAFEADDWVYEILLKNISANSKEKIIIPHFGAVHNINNETLFYPIQDFKKYQTYGSHGIDYTTHRGRKVKSLTIDSLDIQEIISFMKIDIEGGDLKAMQGARKTILKNKMPIIFEYQYVFEDKYKMCFQDYIDFVESINYRFSKVINNCNFLILPK
jgi:FkbM family methyltransferase